MTDEAQCDSCLNLKHAGLELLKTTRAVAGSRWRRARWAGWVGGSAGG
jgi:hypothetical protein